MMIYLLVYGWLLLASIGLVSYCAVVMSRDDMPLTLSASARAAATRYVPKIDYYREMAWT